MTDRARWVSDDRAVSELIGFILIFGLIISTVAVVSVAGFGSLSDRQTAEQVNNVERAFSVLADNIDDLTTHQDTERATEVRLAEGQLTTGEPLTVRFGVTEENATELNNSVRNNTEPVNFTAQNESDTIDPIVYEIDSQQVIVELGGVLRTRGEQSTVAVEPDFSVDPESGTIRLSYPSTVIRGSGESIGAPTTVRIETERATRPTVETFDIGSGRFAMELSGERAELWAAYFETVDGLTVVTGESRAVIYADADSYDQVTSTITGVNVRYT
ncbi:DUF7289 family protein [Halalkalirubrum salinum]|uniref:DUF7289 family protein n=1 Tax=Halalkalirubrum salinum TaxID=2563889 RepID=UPI0010FB2816|nr:hypothetical protein [Halalkalirubrum salinum]